MGVEESRDLAKDAGGTPSRAELVSVGAGAWVSDCPRAAVPRVLGASLCGLWEACLAQVLLAPHSTVEGSQRPEPLSAG